MQRMPKEIYKRGDFYWCSFSHGGKTIRKRLSTTKLQSLRTYRELRRDLDLEWVQDNGNHFPWKELRKLYREWKKGRHANWEDRELMLDQFDQFASVKFVDEITEQLIDDFRQWRLSGDGDPYRQPVTRRTINTYVDSVKAALNWAAGSGKEIPTGRRLIATNPIAHVKPLAVDVEPDPPRQMTEDEIRTLLRVAPKHLRRMIVVQAATEATADELCDLEFDDLDFNHRFVEIRSRDTRIPMYQWLYDMFSEIHREAKHRRIVDTERYFAAEKSKTHVFVSPFCIPMHGKFENEFYRYCRQARILGGTPRGAVYPESVDGTVAVRVLEELQEAGI